MAGRRYGWLIASQSGQPIRSQIGGLLIYAGAPLLLLAGIITLILTYAWLLDLFSIGSGYEQRMLSIGYGGVTLILIVLLFYGAGHVLMVGRRMRLVDGVRLLERDRRAPIVFLRSFFEDYREASSHPVGDISGGQVKQDFGHAKIGAVDLSFRKRATQELRLDRLMRALGPFVAIGRPSDRLAPRGAARIYVDDEHWQGAVRGLIGVARAIVIQPEDTPGTFWELQTVAAQADLRRVLMLVPDPKNRPLAYTRVRDLTANLLPTPLPPQPGSCDAIMFDAAGRPSPLLLKAGLQPFLTQLRQLKEP
jgi:hypothetical protein